MRSVACLTTLAAMAAAGAAMAQSQPQDPSRSTWSASYTRAAQPGERAPNGAQAGMVTVISSTPVIHPTDGQMDGRRGRWSGSSVGELRGMTENARVPDVARTASANGAANATPTARLNSPALQNTTPQMQPPRPGEAATTMNNPARPTPPVSSPDVPDNDTDTTEPKTPNPQ